MYALVMNSAGKSNPHPSTKAAGEFWNEGKWASATTYMQSFNLGSAVLPEISLDEKNHYYVITHPVIHRANQLNLTYQSLSCAEQ